MASPLHENDEERPQSIAALRSKFESLAIAGVSPAPTDVPSATNGHATVSSIRNGLLSPRPETPVDGQKAKPVPPPKPASRPVSPATTSPAPQPSSLLPPPAPRQAPSRPTTPKPSFQTHHSTSSVTSIVSAASDSHLKPSDTMASPPTVISPAVSPAPTPLRKSAPSVPSKPPSVAVTPSGSDGDEDEPVITSVKALREKFSGQAQASEIALRKPVDVPKASAVSVVKAATVHDSPEPLCAPSATLIPAPIPAPVIQRTLDGKTSPVMLSPASEGEALSDTNDYSSHPTAPLAPPAPPAPISRISSPVPAPAPAPSGPPPINRAHKPPPRTAISPAPIFRPESNVITPNTTSPPIPGNKPVIPFRSSSAPEPAVPPPPPERPQPPQLPVRRPTFSSPDTLEPSTASVISPPALASTPLLHTIHDDTALAPTPAPATAPPPLPDRSRANTINRSESESSATTTGPPPPRLPARHAAIPVSAGSGPTSSNANGSGSTTMNPPPPPAHPASPSKTRINSGGPPPPLLRSATVNRGSSVGSGSGSGGGGGGSPPRRSNTISRAAPFTQEKYSTSATSLGLGEKGVYSDEDDEPEEPGAVTNLSAQAKRMLDEFPDMTEANRRPPVFVPDIRVKECHHVSAFAVYGRYVCTGAHHVRVYDTQLSDHAISVVDLKETGLESRGKDPKVTAMCFRPGATESEEGRYLWCGTKDGHLWELDISTGEVTSTKAFVHTSSISYIWRHRKNIISLDEGGKLLVFDVGDIEGKPPTMARQLRIGDKFGFAKLICGKLWTSSGPLTRSTTSSATSKGPTVRIYDPCAPGTMPPPKTIFATEWAGAVTSATYMPLHHDTIFLGHEGGFVSVWDGKELVCRQVLKISSTDVLALEGVGEYLWTGNRKGQIHVFDIKEKPWLATNIWIGHPDNPVQSLVVDPYSIQSAGRYTCWSFARDALRAWDGLLSVDWIDKQLTARQSSFCTFRPVNVLICTWNIDSAKPTDLNGSVANAHFLEDVLRSVDSPDIIVFGFQEVIPLTDKKYTAKTLLFGNKSKDGGAAADRVSHAYRHWLEKLQSAVQMASPSNCPYIKIHSESLVGLFTCIFVKQSEKISLRDLDITTVKRGIGGIYGNKGAIVSRLVMDDTSICFINVHLAAGQSQKASRNADLAGILEDKAIFPPADELPFVHGGCGTGILDHEMVFLNGDLNYRIDQRRENVISSIANGELAYLLEHDQLRKEMRTNHAFRLRNFEEAPITFAPTYKYDPGTHDYDSSEKRRIPAWCDRILYKKSPRVQALNYQRYEPTVSDHRPVSAGYTIILKAIDSLKMMDVRREATGEWAKREKELLEKMQEVFDGIE
ncbi:type I inositol-1,4,5-trisphosphate 5-phosphatase 1 [Cryptococcus neoformans]|nr:type I inositol-1,4,5-trisphosphate 5-phosphatase 1 [Cryptococcus neoformans var. grubii Th84]OXH09586.1 type I inositol-1,4,5-trisphosphate 5-phosphatase 1 [Cryptococcus neoformans var. grubii]OXH30617.1 type I inositol-1,4,5-trisphosphate 5-phosphatase 1 [Cryptococcus neoformans var. grubii]OXH50520.1 type I inositol-1,4,5-trisphosphate 5-phosphatase 1 [Cryptococcus neoformans var. grubii]OXH51195.1 type I inositol-1,4,5-trisphosphate 5-phosphatase 1 [Cryptococcus neoformans var. grubii]